MVRMSTGAETVKRERVSLPTPATAPAKSRWQTIPGFAPRGEDAFAHVLTRIPATVLIGGAGIATTAIYILFTLAFPITRWYNHPHLASNPNIITDLGQLTHYSPLAAIGFVAAMLALFFCQFLAYTALARRKPETAPWLKRIALGLPLVWVSVLIWMQPVTSTDLYGYIARGYLYDRLHLNPMTNPAFLLPGSLLVSRPPAPYGPVWMLIAGAFSAISADNLLLNMLLFKVVGALSVIACSVLLYLLARRLYPAAAAKIVLFFAWNPLVLWEEVGNGHNDAVMMACVLFALLLMVWRRPVPALAFLVLGALIKYTAAFLIPLWLVYELGQLRPAVSTALAGVRAGRGRRTRIAHYPVPAPAHSPPANGASGTSAASASRRAARMGAAHGYADAPSHLMAPGSPPPGTAPHGAANGAGNGNGASATLAGSARTAFLMLREVDRGAAARLVGAATVLGVALAAIGYAPFWQGIQTFSGLGQQVRPLYYNGSIVQFLVGPLELFVPPDSYGSLDKTIRLVFYALFLLYAWIQTHRLWLAGPAATMRDVITAGAKVMFAALLLIAFWFQPWYVVWLLPLAALADETFIRTQAVILSVGSLLTYAVAYFLFANETGLGQSFFVQVSEVVVTFLPLLLLRNVPRDRGWPSVLRGYGRAVLEALRQRPAIWDRVMVGLILVVAILLRMVRLGNLFGSISPDDPAPNTLRQVTGDLRLYLADPHGLQLPFVLLQRLSVLLFGQTAFALLLPTAIIGSLTVALIYLVTTLIFADGPPARARLIGLLAALLAATSQWHVSLSRAGMQVVILPFLMCLALYLLLLAWRARPATPAHAPTTRHAARHHRHAPSHASSHAPSATRQPAERLLSRRMLLFAGSGLAAGLASDLAPGLWLLPLLVLAAVGVAAWRQPAWFKASRAGLAVLAGTTIIAGLPGAWEYGISRLLTAASTGASAHHGAVGFGGWLAGIGAYLAQAGRNAGAVLAVLTAQDYSAAWPSTGGTPILPGVVSWFFFAGVALIIWFWRRPSSLLLLLLLAFPLLASIAIGSEANVLQAASVLPAICIVPALALYECGRALGRLFIAFDRAIGVRIFANPERIGRVLLMAFLLFSALRTFFWYFQATLPITPPNVNLPT
jgi:4-amino-4-deoxy-L-arabinose transferase-like glycosyltransferase